MSFINALVIICNFFRFCSKSWIFQTENRKTFFKLKMAQLKILKGLLIPFFFAEAMMSPIFTPDGKCSDDICHGFKICVGIIAI